MQVEFKFLPSFSQNEKFTFDQPIYTCIYQSVEVLP